MVTGGSALGFWGHIRTTMDIDIIISIRKEQINPFLESLLEEAYVDPDTAREAISRHGMFNVIYQKTCFKVDLIPLKKDRYEQEKFSNRLEINLGSNTLSVISPEDLIISKLLWSKSAGGSERQLRDCASIYRLNAGELNESYLKQWFAELGLEEEFNKII